MTWAVQDKGYSQRRACGLVSLHAKTYRYASKRTSYGDLRATLRKLTSQRRRFGYTHYYNVTRTHWSLGKDAPLYRLIERDGRVTSRAILGGLHHRYVRI